MSSPSRSRPYDRANDPATLSATRAKQFEFKEASRPFLPRRQMVSAAPNCGFHPRFRRPIRSAPAFLAKALRQEFLSPKPWRFPRRPRDQKIPGLGILPQVSVFISNGEKVPRHADSTPGRLLNRAETYQAGISNRLTKQAYGLRFQCLTCQNCRRIRQGHAQQAAIKSSKASPERGHHLSNCSPGLGGGNHIVAFLTGLDVLLDQQALRRNIVCNHWFSQPMPEGLLAQDFDGQLVPPKGLLGNFRTKNTVATWRTGQALIVSGEHASCGAPSGI